MLQVLTATDSLVLAAANFPADRTSYTWPPSSSNDCSRDGATLDVSQLNDGGLGRDDVFMDWDMGLFSFAGCRCTAGYDNVYYLDAGGEFPTCDLAW